MAAQGAIKDSFTFVGGLYTEGGYFVTPDNTWKEGVNIVPDVDGSISRRTGLDYEDSYTLYASTLSEDTKKYAAYTVGLWATVGGNSALNFFVAQLGTTLHFYESFTGTVSDTKKAFTVDLSIYRAQNNTTILGTSVVSLASTYGELIVTASDLDPIRITYNATAGTVTTNRITLQIRDFEGFESPFAVDAEKTEAEWTNVSFLTQARYNLYNQGWTDTLIDAYKAAYGGKLPANSKTWIDGKNTSDVFDPALLNKQDFGSSPAPRGRYILSAFAPTRNGLTTTYSSRPTVCSFFAGRVWYAGLSSAKDLGTVYFSQVLDTLTKAGYCYQQNDPTSETFSDLLDSDGGVIQIPEAGEILGLQPLGRGLVVLATNGIWFISGTDTAFTAANYSVIRVSNVGCVSAKSIVPIEESVLYWSNTGVYSISPGQTAAAEFSSVNLSDKNIKTFYQNIPTLNKTYAEGAYNASNKTIYWLYNKTNPLEGTIDRYLKTSALVVDTKLGSWYWFDFDTSLGVVPLSIETTKETIVRVSTASVKAGVDTVIWPSGNVISYVTSLNSTIQQFKVLTLHPVTSNNYSVTFSDFYNTRSAATKFKDWYSYNAVGIDAVSYIITGYNLGNTGAARSKTGQYVSVFLKRTETSLDNNANPVNESSCLMETRWDFTDNNYANKWQTPVQVYKHLRPFFGNPGDTFEDSYPLVITKNKLRGRGKAVQLKFSSESGKDMKLVGWSSTFIGNTGV